MAAVTFDAVAARLRPSSALVTAASNGDRAGSVATFHTQCGFDPICYAVWLPTRSRTCSVARHAAHIAVHVLDDDWEAIEDPLTEVGDIDTDMFDQYDWRPGPGGVPLLATCSTYLVLGLVPAPLEHGGYTCLIGELLHAVARPAGTPLTLAGRDVTHPGSRPDAIDAHQLERRPDPIGAMDAETRRQFINVAIGAGHAVDLPGYRERA